MRLTLRCLLVAALVGAACALPGAASAAVTCDLDVAITTGEDTPVTTAIECATNGTGPLILGAPDQPTHGAATVIGTDVRYVPFDNYSGTDEFTVTATDNGVSDTRTFSVTVQPVDDPPSCGPTVQLFATEDQVGIIGVGCTDIDSGDITYSIATQPAKGTVGMNGVNAIFAPRPDANGGDAFTIRATADGAATTRDVVVTIAPVDDPPVCSGSPTLTTAEDTRGAIDVSCVDVDGTITYAVVSAAKRGKAALAGATLVYDPTVDLNGTDQVVVSATSDGHATLRAIDIVVTRVDDPPQCRALTMNTRQGEPVTGIVGCFDVDGGPAVFALAATPKLGAVRVTPEGIVSYQPAPTTRATDTFTMTVTGGGATNVVTGKVVVVPVDVGGSDDDRLVGDAGPNKLSGRAGNDMLDGGAGNDVLDGGAGNDKLFGAAGNDKLAGGAGVDQISGGSGNDVINAVDAKGTRDVIACGPGKDTVLANVADKVGRDCEKVRRRP